MTEEQPAAVVRVMIVDDHPVWRDGIRADLESSGVATVVAEATDGGEAIELANTEQPDVILMDLNMPTVRGADAIAQILSTRPDARILVLSASGEEADVLEAVKRGALGYLLKSSTSDELIDAIVRVDAGEPVFTPSLAGLVLSEFRRTSSSQASGQPGLSEAENEVLVLVAKGYTYPQIAAKRHTAVKTVQNQVQHILEKLQFHSRYELMRYAIQKGIDRTSE